MRLPLALLFVLFATPAFPAQMVAPYPVEETCRCQADPGQTVRCVLVTSFADCSVDNHCICLSDNDPYPKPTLSEHFYRIGCLKGQACQIDMTAGTGRAPEYLGRCLTP